jgi:sRNA-binding protein
MPETEFKRTAEKVKLLGRERTIYSAGKGKFIRLRGEGYISLSEAKKRDAARKAEKRAKKAASKKAAAKKSAKKSASKKAASKKSARKSATKRTKKVAASAAHNDYSSWF